MATRKTSSKKSGSKKSRSKKQKKTAVVAPVKLPARLLSFLTDHKAKYNARQHRTVFTAYDVAQTLKIDLKSVAKALFIQADREWVLVVVPANRNLDFQALKKTINAELKKSDGKLVKKISLATERSITKDVSNTPGAVPPFGPLLKLSTYVDRGLMKAPFVIVNGGYFETSLEMKPKEYLRLTEGILGSFSKKRD
jgi:Ala-tRNA(Pro) deacylase